MPKKSIFIAATGQNVGKTTLCLGILAALQKRYPSVGFIKPVGQQHVKVEQDINVDKDVVLFKQHFSLPANWSDMSPVIIPSGFTRRYLEGQITETEMLQKIQIAFHRIHEANDYTVVEGTGHVGVGSIMNLNNAKIAADLGLDIAIIASGGLGSAHDELMLNIAVCKQYGIRIRGVILNKVLDDKRQMILEYFPRCLKKWDIPLIGCVPFNEFLSNPTIKDFENLFETTLLTGERHRYRHFQHTRLVAGSLEAYMSEMVPNELVITPASREDIILATLQKHLHAAQKENCGGMILTGKQPPNGKILERISLVDIPILYVPLCSYDAMKMITSFTAKIRTEDIPKVEKAISLVEENLDLDLLCKNGATKPN
jgi:phosphate acetyltransferase